MREFEIPVSSEKCRCPPEGEEEDKELQDGFHRLRESDATTPLRKHLSKSVFLLLRYRKTRLGARLLDVVRAGLMHHDAPVGAVLPDQLAYDTFRALLDPLLAERHFGFDARCCAEAQPDVAWGDWRRVRALDPQRRFVQRVAVSASRNLDGYRFTPTMTPKELNSVQEVIAKTLINLFGEYRGTFDDMQLMHPSRKKVLERYNCLFDCGDKFDHAANIPRFWTDGRGVYVSCDRSFVVWVNAKDHLRVICQEEGGDLQAAYRRLAYIMPYIDYYLSPARHELLGHLTVGLDDIGSGLRIEADVRFPAFEVERCRATLEYTAKVYHMEIHWLQNDLYRVLSRSRLGFTEFEVMKEFILGLRGLLATANFYEGSENEEGEDSKMGDGEDNIVGRRRKMKTSSKHSRESPKECAVHSTMSVVSAVKEELMSRVSNSGNEGGRASDVVSFHTHAGLQAIFEREMDVL